MSKTNKKEERKADKVMTKYDRKMQERKEKAAKEKRDNLRSKIVTAAVAVVLIGAIVVSIAVSTINQRKAISEVYMKVGEHEITFLEYDYYYNLMVSNYVNSYSVFLPYIGLDTTKDFDKQQYDETHTWDDFFDNMTVQKIKETKAMIDDAKAAGFVYENEAQEYEEIITGFKTQAETERLSLTNYYRTYFGEYATQERVEPFVKETLLAGAYEAKLMEDNKPAEEEITTRYEENKNQYDTVSYGLYTFFTDVTGESSEDEIKTAMEAAEAKANEMKEARLAGEDFQALCNQYDGAASEENSEANSNITEGASYASVSTIYADWLYDDARTANDIEVFVDDTYHCYYVVEFIEKAYKEDTNDVISTEISTERVEEYKAELGKKYEVVDVAGELKFLTLPVIEETAE